MKFRTFLLCAAAVMLFASVSSAQLITEFWYSHPDFGGLLLTENCDGTGAPLAEGTAVWIYWDANNNGQWANPSTPCLGLDPNDAPVPTDGNIYSANYNQIPIGMGGSGPGAFLADDPAWVVFGGIPSVAKYYLVVTCNGNPQWVTQVYTLGAGPHPTFITPDAWTCCTCIVVPPCEPTQRVDIPFPGGGPNFPGPLYWCVDVCLGSTTPVYIYGANANHIPHAHTRPGCFRQLPPPLADCDEECPPVPCELSPLGWVYDPLTSSWSNVIIGGGEGCCCFVLDYIEPAAAGTFDAIARDNSVELNWNTLAESNVDYFEISRARMGSDAEVIAEVEAVNEATGANYTHVDGTARNGVTYEYSIVTVNLDGSRENWGVTVSATPNSNNAVITEYALNQNYPNPFNPTTTISYDVLNENFVSLTVFNAMGQEVAKLVNNEQKANGRHTVEFSSTNLTSGLYFYTVKIGNEFTATKKMLLVK
jgi:hypothetical protein